MKLLLTGRLPTGCIWTGDDRKGSIAGLHCQKPLGEYVQEMCCAHVQELEKKVLLPKGK